MPPAMLTTVDERGWCEHVEGADGLAVVFFFAPWCRTCKAVRPVVERLERSHEDVSFFQADFKQSAALCYRQRVFAFPTVHFYLPGVGRVGRCVPSAKGADAKLRSQLARPWMPWSSAVSWPDLSDVRHAHGAMCPGV